MEQVSEIKNIKEYYKCEENFEKEYHGSSDNNKECSMYCEAASGGESFPELRARGNEMSFKELKMSS